MNTDHFKQLLFSKEDQLRDQIDAFRSEVRQTPEAVGDAVDEATSDQDKSTALEENTLATETLRQVQEALQRIKEGTYGRCLDCGREIENARLEAVPWARYCLDDQQRHDQEGLAAAGGSTI
ncbi:MAG TPA: TraR/DksA family transcriptional regulator [Bryobacteraceae bacterium]|jgi:DnaK suppressor protein